VARNSKIAELEKLAAEKREKVKRIPNPGLKKRFQLEVDKLEKELAALRAAE